MNVLKAHKKKLTPPESAEDTRQRLLEAAGEVFAEKGFRSATVREICSRAGANVAAVNYHFGDKDRLYAAVLKYAHRRALEKFPPSLGLPESASAEDRLKVFIRSFLYRVLDEGRPSWHGKLMTRELADPTAALDSLVEESIRPTYETLTGIIGEMLGKAASSDLRYFANSIVGQCVFYCHAAPVLERLAPGKFKSSEIERLAEHISQFSLCALRQPRKTGGRRNK